MTAHTLPARPATRLRRLTTAAVAAAALVVAAPAAAWAQPDGAESGRDFGQHVAAHADHMGFDGAHNPGMHWGFAGWPHHHPHR